MDTLDANIFSYCICPHLSGKIIDDIFLVNKHYNTVVKADIKHLYNLFWISKDRVSSMNNYKYLEVYKDGKLEGEQLVWYSESGQLIYKRFYKEGEKEGPHLAWYEDGRLWYKHFYKNGKMEGEQLVWYEDGELQYKYFYKGGERVIVVKTN